MAHASQTVQVDAPRSHVFEMGTDCSLLAQWNVSYTEVRDCSGHLDHVGARYTAVARVLGRTIEGPWEVTEFEAGRRVKILGTAAGGARAEVTTTFTDRDGGTEVRTDVDYQLPGGMFSGVMERLVGPSVDRDLRHTAENFKALCEAMVTART